MFVVLPNHIAAEIDAALDAEIAKQPDAAKDRAALRAQLIECFSEYGFVPEFSLTKARAA